MREKFPGTAAVLACRPRQWTKNLIVFAAPLFAFDIGWKSLAGSALAFALFCCASSAFYLLNDLADIEADRQHPIKCKRPIAAGLVAVPTALTMAVGLLTLALVVGWFRSPSLFATLLAYACLQVAYNLKLKHKPIVDIISIAAGFVLRSFAGFAATGIALSHWFILCVAMLALFLAVEKRKAELQKSTARGGGKTRAVLRRYSLPLLSRMESVMTTGAVMSYAIWSSGPQVQGASTPWMMVTFPFVLYGIFRYQLLSDVSEKLDVAKETGRHKSTERPDEVLLRDRPILLTVILWAGTVFLVQWLKVRGIIE